MRIDFPRRKHASLLPTLLLLTAMASAQASAQSIEVRVAGVKDNRGMVRVAVCDQQRFLKQCAHSGSAAAQEGETVVTVTGVPAGTWAVLAYHDVDGNGELDRNWVGMPTEAYGFSRDAAGRFGPPDFAAAAIDVHEAHTVVRIGLR